MPGPHPTCSIGRYGCAWLAGRHVAPSRCFTRRNSCGTVSSHLPDTLAPLSPSLISPALPLSAQSAQVSLAQFLRDSRLPAPKDQTPPLTAQHAFPTTTTFRGKLYELAAQTALRSLGFSLHRTGRPGDLGVDLLGHWHLPGSSAPLRCLVQCKNTAKRLGPSVVRELGGAFEGAPAGWRGESAGPETEPPKGADSEQTNHETQSPGISAQNSTIAVLCASQEATRGVRDAIKRAARPLVWVLVRAPDAADLYRILSDEDESVMQRAVAGGVIQVLWNERVALMGLRGVEVGWTYGSGCEEKMLRLRWKGRLWEPQIQQSEAQY